MIKLVQSGLFGDHLVKVDKPLMVKRYNECLRQIGLTETTLKNFHIDGLGWSPEIAEEQNNRFYLSHGLANPYGIIISPEQKNASLYLPYHTFDWDIHKYLFDQYLNQIIDLTTQTGIWFEMDQDISAYRSPTDLLLMQIVHVTFNAADIIVEAAKSQKALISEFNGSENAWMDKELRSKIMESSAKHGDLRFRKFELPEISITDTQCFFTQAFDGVFVFNKRDNHKPLLIFLNNNSGKSGELEHSHIEFNINDSGLITYLYNQNLILDNQNYYLDNVTLLETFREFTLAECANKFDQELEIVNLNSSQKKGILNKMIQKDCVDPTYFELERLISKISEGHIDNQISDELRPYIIHPNSSLSKQEKIVLWQLITATGPYNPVLHYLFDKSGFYNDYQQWNEVKRNWVIQELLIHRALFYKLIN